VSPASTRIPGSEIRCCKPASFIQGDIFNPNRKRVTAIRKSVNAGRTGSAPSRFKKELEHGGCGQAESLLAPVNEGEKPYNIGEREPWCGPVESRSVS